MGKNKQSWLVTPGAAALALGIAAFAAAPAWASSALPTNLYAFVVPNDTGASQTSLSLVLSGDQTNSLPGSGSTTGVENSLGGAYGVSTPAGSTNGPTTVTFSSATASSLAANGAATVGFQWSNPFSPPAIDSAAWGGGSAIDFVSMSDQSQLAAAAVTADPYMIDVLDVSHAGLGANVVTQYQEQQYTGNPPSITFTNNTSVSEILSSAEYYISPTEIPLSDLNATDYPPSDSVFTPLPSSYDTTLSAGGSETFVTPTPEPATFGIAALGIVGLAGLARRKRCARWPVR